MATIVIGPGNTIRPHRNVRKRNFPETAAQSFVIGDVLVLDTTGGKEDQVKLAGADPTTDRGLVGIAAEAASGVEGNSVSVYLLTPDSEFKINGNAALAKSQIGSQFGIVRDNTNKLWQLDISEVTAKIFSVLELIDAPADVNGQYVVRPVQSEPLYGAN